MFNDRETATLLAALRYWQIHQLPLVEFDGQMLENAIDPRLQEHFSQATPLRAQEIDDLCEAINTSDLAARELPDEQRCSVCRRWCRTETVHVHQGDVIGDECCFVEQLRASE